MNRIKELRKDKGISQAELADRAGVSRQAISFYEKGKRHPKIETWQKIANALDTSIPYARGEINTELIAKIAKMVYLLETTDFDIDLNKEELFTGYEDDLSKMVCKLMLLLLQQLNLDCNQELECIVTKGEKLLGKSDSDPAVNHIKTKEYYEEDILDSPNDDFKTDIEDAKRLIDFYDNL